MLCLRGQLFEIAYVTGWGLPAGNLLIDWLTFLQCGDVGGEAVNDLAIYCIASTDVDGGERVQDIEPGEDDAIETVHLDAKAASNDVEPAAAPWSASGSPVFLGSFPDELAGLIFEFGRHGATAHPGDICLENASDSVDIMEADAGAGGTAGSQW